MTQKELIENVANDLGTTQKQAAEFLNSLNTQIIKALKEEGKIQIQALGIFEVKKRAARTGRSPKTGETIEIPAKNVAVFKPSKNLKESILES